MLGARYRRGVIMIDSSDFRTTRMPLDHGAGRMPVLGTAARARENLDISALPEDALDEINRIQTKQRFNEVVKTGSPGFIPQGR
jgi:hypothetical protein